MPQCFWYDTLGGGFAVSCFLPSLPGRRQAVTSSAGASKFFEPSLGFPNCRFRYLAVGQNQRYHFGVGAPPSLVYFSGDWDVHWGVRAFDPLPFRNFSRFGSCLVPLRSRLRLLECGGSPEDSQGPRLMTAWPSKR